MGIDLDSKLSTPGARPVDGKAIQPTLSSHSKAKEAAGLHQHHNIMATIADDDDRLLVRIGYTPVGAPCWT
jgi:hypothetical protein